MAIYEYRCERHGAFDEERPMGTAPAVARCPTCREEGRRVYSAPLLTSTAPALAAALDHSERTRHEPDVVTSLPSKHPRKRQPMARMTPQLARLPRP